MAVAIPSLDEGDQALKDRGRVLVETHDESRLDLQTGALDLFTLSIRSRFRFWSLLHSARLSSFGDSMPTKTWSNPALTMSCISSSSSARLMDTSV